MKKKLMVLNGSHSDLPLILRGNKLGFEVITLGNDSSLIGHTYADKHIDIDYSNEEDVCECARYEKIDYICSCANGLGIFSACYTAEKLGLPGHDSYEVCYILHHKDKFKDFVRKYNVLSPYCCASVFVLSSKSLYIDNTFCSSLFPLTLVRYNLT